MQPEPKTRTSKLNIVRWKDKHKRDDMFLWFIPDIGANLSVIAGGRLNIRGTGQAVADIAHDNCLSWELCGD